TGSVDIEPDGSVSAYALDKPEALPGYVVDLVRRASAGWRFEPVVADGEAVAARARMTLRLLATPVGDDEFELTISAATFGSLDAADTASLRAKRLRPPKYPPTAAH